MYDKRVHLGCVIKHTPLDKYNGMGENCFMDIKSLCCVETLIRGKSGRFYCKKCLREHVVLCDKDNISISKLTEEWVRLSDE
jgi:hypothetical protein